MPVIILVVVKNAEISERLRKTALCDYWMTADIKYGNIQGDSWLVDITAGGDFLGLCDQKSSYKHVSDVGRLWSYGHFLIPVHALVWTMS
jgi:hypothetical protein